MQACLFLLPARRQSYVTFLPLLSVALARCVFCRVEATRLGAAVVADLVAAACFTALCVAGLAAALVEAAGVEAKTGAEIIIVEARPSPTRVVKRAIFFTPEIREKADRMNHDVQAGRGRESQGMAPPWTPSF